MTDQIRRRRLLYWGGAALAVGVAGCQGTGPVELDGSGEPTDSAGSTGDATSPRRDADSGGVTTWRQKGSDPGHSGVTAATGVPTDGEVDWQLSGESSGNPVVSDGALFHVADLGTDPDRTPIWRSPTDTGETTTPTATSTIDGVSPAADRYLVRRDARDGDIEWVQPIEVGTVLTARDLDDGSEQWSVAFDDDGLPRGPVVRGGTVYVAPDDRGVFALDAATGDQRWHYEGDTSNAVHVAASDDTAYLLDDGVLRARDAISGTDQWSVSVSEDGSRVAPAIDREAIYLGTGGMPADFLVLSRSDGSERWRHQLPEVAITDVIDSGLRDQPTVVDGAAYANTVDGLYAFGEPG